MDLNKWMTEIHRNAKEHGWWDGERDFNMIVDLIHSEWSEALEEERAGRPYLWHGCITDGGVIPCETCLDCMLKAEYPNGVGCRDYVKKPEGVAVELLDGCIRILDLLGHVSKGEKIFKNKASTIDKMCDPKTATELTGLKDGMPRDFFSLIRRLHMLTDTAGEGYVSLIACLVICFNWIKYQYKVDPELLMMEKHEYNKTRPYKHGKKF